MAGLQGSAPAGEGAGLQLSGGKAGLPAAVLGQQQQGAQPAQAAWGSALWAAQLLQQGGDDLITPPSNAEAPLGLGGGGGGGARPAPQCLLCGGLGTSAVCGALRPATYEGQPAAVHHLCAIWSPGCFQREGSSVYVNLEEEARRARNRTCSVCGLAGASLLCAQPGCRTAFHLPCAVSAPNVMLEHEAYEVWCAHHADSDNSDEDYSLAAPRSRRTTGGGGGKRQRATSDVQRPRTDWQKKDDNTWYKVVPPWWCEQRTVHFASKVYKELFKSGSTTMLVDASGAEYQCVVQSEARNDMRPQFTLRGEFADLWREQGISAGDTLVFKRDVQTGHIELSRIAAGAAAAAAARMEEGAASELSDPSALEGFEGGRRGRQREASSDQTRGTSQQGAQSNRWMELADGWAIKTVYKSSLAHNQCPIAGWLFKKLYGRLPADADSATVYDPDLDADFCFDVNFISAANVHYLTGRTFSGWVREAGLQAGEQIRMKKEGGRVLIQRVPADRKIKVDYTTKATSRSLSVGGGARGAVAGAPEGAGQELASPPPADALEALDALVAAAGYAGAHGTPAIQAALAGAAGAAAAAAIAAAGLPAGGGLQGVEALLQQGLDTAGLAALPQSKRRRTDAAELQLLEQQALAARRNSGAAGWAAGAFQLRQGASPRASGDAAASLAGWQPSHPHVLMLRAINQVLEGHQWSVEEQADCLRFRAKFAWLDGCGREMVYEEVQRLAADKPALLVYLRAVAQGILAPLPTSGTVTPAAAAAGPAATPRSAAANGAAPVGAVQPAAAVGTGAGTPAAIKPDPEAEADAAATAPGEPPLALALADAPLEGATSLSLDLLLGGSGGLQEHSTPNPTSLLGPF
ncbi:BREAST CANCER SUSCEPTIBILITY 1-like protein isoform B [Chlorella sorokiniana]|uniref:BREAST CANCER SUSCEPTIBILITY 1-like protein isoform B n=1 Tax=Chlorella sorokiniana TaxID=3076 RepID=A0A2P6TZF1_CHLSO|nr:BREAST CANCER SUSCEPTIBILITY 1-like protein isoform B [Chlorella sorokiniana]|eukprot:PRW59423.1 BREAST CANCER SUSCEPTIBILITY 1-like protein isoform B [Chlorella sorokiniana]